MCPKGITGGGWGWVGWGGVVREKRKKWVKESIRQLIILAYDVPYSGKLSRGPVFMVDYKL